MDLNAPNLEPSLRTPAGVLPASELLGGVPVTVGEVIILADFAALMAPGEFQVNFRVPPEFANFAEGDYPISIQYGPVRTSLPVSINTAPPGKIVLPVQP
jgi:uncharacterized protein (TIGR03437 family)